LNEEQADRLIDVIKPISEFYQLKRFKAKEIIAKVLRIELKGSKTPLEIEHIINNIMVEIATYLREE